MNQAVKQNAHAVLDGFFSAPTSEPLVIEKVGSDGVIFSRGIPKTRMTITEAAAFLGMSRPTLYKRYINRRQLRVGTDGKISRKAVLDLFNSLDGKD